MNESTEKTFQENKKMEEYSLKSAKPSDFFSNEADPKSTLQN